MFLTKRTTSIEKSAGANDQNLCGQKKVPTDSNVTEFSTPCIGDNGYCLLGCCQQLRQGSLHNRQGTD